MLERTTHYSSVVTVGDLNLHLDVKNDPGTMKFESLLAANNYMQHWRRTSVVTCSTSC